MHEIFFLFLILICSHTLNGTDSQPLLEHKRNEGYVIVSNQLLAHGRWLSPGTPTSSTTETGDIAEILLKVVLNHYKSISTRPQKQSKNDIQVNIRPVVTESQLKVLNQLNRYGAVVHSNICHCISKQISYSCMFHVMPGYTCMKMAYIWQCHNHPSQGAKTKSG